MGAAMSPTLSRFLPPTEILDRIIYDVLGSVDQMRHLSPSIKLGVDLLQEAFDRKRHYIARREKR